LIHLSHFHFMYSISDFNAPNAGSSCESFSCERLSK
jgi:hypothetical protein